MVKLAEKEAQLNSLFEQVKSCQGCALGQTRTQPVFGVGSAAAPIMFVGEAPGFHEDQQGIPFVGQAGKLLDKLLARIGLQRGQIYIANVLKCRPPNNRDPQADEIAQCRSFLERQIAIIKPQAVCTMGNFATKLLSGKPDGISRVHGQPQPLPGADSDTTLLYPVYHPAAALYTPTNLGALEADFDRLALLLKRVEQPQVKVEPLPSQPEPAPPAAAEAEPEQMGLF